MPAVASPAAQDYLKCIYSLMNERGDRMRITTKAVADRMGVSAASATNMLKKLHSMGLAAHRPYRGVELTESGLKIALEVIRHHRLLETYLAEALGVPWDRVHQEAEVLEHVLSEDLEERIATLLGDPTEDPHGHPIPSRELDMPVISARVLWQVDDGQEVAVDRVSDSAAEALRYLDELGIRPGVKVRVLDRGPVDGPLFVDVEGRRGQRQALSRELAEGVWVA
jgi:DtxR family Mn-dependent transcriptional regulator